VNRLNKDLRKAKQFIIVKETRSEDKDKDKDKDKKKKYIYSKDIDTGVATPKKKIFGDNTATEAKKLLSKVKKSPDKYKQHSVVRNPRYLTKYQRKEMDIALWDALLDYIDEERYDHMWTHTSNVGTFWSCGKSLTVRLHQSQRNIAPPSRTGSKRRSSTTTISRPWSISEGGLRTRWRINMTS